MRSVLKTLVAALGLSLGANSALAAPVTWTFTGDVHFNLFATGDMVGTVSAFDDYVVTYTFDDPSDSTDCANPAASFYCNYGPGSLSVAISGMTFTVGTPSALGISRRLVVSCCAGEVLDVLQRDYTTQHAAGGNAVSSLARDAFISISFNVHGYGDVLPNAHWPSSIDLLNDFKAPSPLDYSAFSLTFTSATGSLEIFDPKTAFDTFHSTADDPPVGTPAPGGLALLGLGLLGLVATRRRLRRS